MTSTRFVAVALAAAAFIACTNTQPAPPRDFETRPDRASSTDDEAPPDGDDPDLEPRLPEEQPLEGLPAAEPASEPAPAPAPTPTASTSPLCGTGLTCTVSKVTGGKACRPQSTSMTDVYCCPRTGDRIVDGVCVPKLCGTGLICSASPTTGASTCRQTTTSTTNIYCCASGQTIVNGKCV
jgi:hypothetical protein